MALGVVVVTVVVTVAHPRGNFTLRKGGALVAWIGDGDATGAWSVPPEVALATGEPTCRYDSDCGSIGGFSLQADDGAGLRVLAPGEVEAVGAYDVIHAGLSRRIDPPPDEPPHLCPDYVPGHARAAILRR